MKVVQDDLWLCPDCTIAAVNGDVSGVESEEDVEAIWAGLERLGPHLVPDFESEYEDGHEEFSSRGCDCCQSGLAGSLWRFAVLGE